MNDLLSFLETLFSDTDIENVIKNIIYHTKDVVNADRTTLFIYNEEENILESIVATGEDIIKIKLPVNSQSIAGYTFLKDKIVNIKDVYDENELKNIDTQLKHDKTLDKKTGYRTKSILAIPVKKGNKKLGVLELINKEPFFTKEDEKKLKKISKFIAIALENALHVYKLMQKQEEEKSIIENIAEAIAITDVNLKILDVNPSFLEMTGYRYNFENLKNEKITKVLSELKEFIEAKIKVVRKKLLPVEINLELVKVKILPIIVSEFNETKLKKFIFIFKYPKG
jgi:PAS domain S-box-containing protein